jgi:(E)-4-hydroxy-3-methylbut-2-enyl-diphosphate synthase
MRKKTHSVKAGNLIIGGGFPITVQTMWKASLDTIDKNVIKEVNTLAAAGCDMIRCAVPSLDYVKPVGSLAASVSIPVVADIHFDYRIALACMEYPIAKIRINPGNIGSAWKVEEVIKKAKEKNIAIRVGINSGSLPKDLRNENDVASAMIKAAERELDILQKFEFTNAVFSLKSPSVEETIHANKTFSEHYPYPLHLGVTEAGPIIQGVVKNTIAISTLLTMGIGDTVRVSLSDSPLNEVIAGKEIIKACGCGKNGIELISCPMCTRSVFDVSGFLNSVQLQILSIKKSLTIAVMGCPVNGPGEAKKADLGITGTGKYAVIFKGGQIIKKVSLDEAKGVFIKEIEKL